MQVSLKWLKDYVDIEMDPKELAEKLTMAGLEVESVQGSSPPFKRVVVAKILSIKPHPNAEKLSLCEVTTGETIFPVVCGAPNIRVGDVVPLAKVGASIFGGYTITSSRIRGEVSEGMLCSEEELGIGEDATGIMILSNHLILGQDLADVLNLNDTLFDIGITPNRSDCLSIIGIAREIGAINGKKIRYPKIQISENEQDIQQVMSVEIIDTDLCPRYTARIIKDVTIKPSPAWLRMKLETLGLRAINNVVDVTNYVMLELGQPLHAFDCRFLEERHIVVRRAREGEHFTSLDGKERILNPDILMICDGVKPVAIGGIMGGLNSEVKDDTSDILLESAYFKPSSIRKSARFLGMSTDASFRFERGIDPDGVVRALNRATQLIAEVSGGSICKDVIDQYPRKIETAKNIILRHQRVNDILGTTITVPEIINILESLEMVTKKVEAGIYKVTPPTFRVDIAREIDLIEEIARLYGYTRVPMTLPSVSVRTASMDRRRYLQDSIRGIMTGHGYTEIITYSFVSPLFCEYLSLKEGDEMKRVVRIKNPLSEDQSVMRTTLISGLLETAKKNANGGCPNLKVFEVGKTFFHQREGELPVEKNKLGVLLMGLRYDDVWHFKGMNADFYDLKGCVESLFDGLKISHFKFEAGPQQAFLHPGKTCNIHIESKLIGFLGEVHPEVLAKIGLNDRALVCELDLDLLVGYFAHKTTYKEISRYPAILRDVAFLIPIGLTAKQMVDFALSNREELLEKVKVFDVYIGIGIPDGMKSLGLRFSYRSSRKTLTDDEVNQIHSSIVKDIIRLSGAKVRGKEN
jgi:phenylalanyl-tRNA synthetase beta chain